MINHILKTYDLNIKKYIIDLFYYLVKSLEIKRFKINYKT